MKAVCVVAVRGDESRRGLTTLSAATQTAFLLSAVAKRRGKEKAHSQRGT